MFIFNPLNSPSFILRYAAEERENNKEFQEYSTAVFTFTDKVTYLEWVKSWKEQYKALSGKIHRLKELRKVSTVRTEVERKIEPRNAQMLLHWDKMQAGLMLKVRRVGKVKSWEQRNSRLTKEAELSIIHI